jgi:hypothetical protein
MREGRAPGGPPSEASPSDASPSISEITRRALFDDLRRFNWHGRLDELGFLDRVYDLASIPSTDSRADSAAGDISIHRVSFSDWPDDWVFDDSRFGLLDGADEIVLRFLAETVHPAVQPDVEVGARLVALYNAHLKPDGWAIFENGQISGRPVYGWRGLHPGGSVALTAAKSVADVLNAGYVHQQVERMTKAVETDPGLAIGSAKELLETICRGILEARGQAIDPGWDVPQLAKATQKALDLMPDSVPEAAKGGEVVRIILSNLSSVVGRLAELRNLYGTGHGRSPTHKGLQPRHARLAVGAASTLITFLFETHQARPPAAT